MAVLSSRGRPLPGPIPPFYLKALQMSNDFIYPFCLAISSSQLLDLIQVPHKEHLQDFGYLGLRWCGWMYTAPVLTRLCVQVCLCVGFVNVAMHMWHALSQGQGSLCLPLNWASRSHIYVCTYLYTGCVCG